MGRKVALLVMGIAVAASAAAQEQQQPGFVDEARVNNVTVDVQVRDSDGIPVTGLTRADFRLVEDGVEQPLTNFLGVEGGLVDGAADDALVGAPAPRQVVLFFDLYLMVEADKRMVLDSLRSYLEDGLPPAMTLAIVSFDGALHVHTPPTNSRNRIFAALGEVERTTATGLQRQVTLGSFSVADMPDRGESPRSADWRYSDVDWRRLQNQEFWSEMRRMIARVETGFTAAVQRFSDTSARKVVVMISPGFPRSENLPMYRNYDLWTDVPSEYRNVGLWGRAAETAGELEYTLYTLDPSGNQILNADAGVARAPEFNDVASVAFWREADRRDNLIQAARHTGGEALFTADGGAAFAKVEKSTASFYSLGFQPDHYGDGEEHEIRVEVVGRPDVELTYRSSYVDRPFDQRDAERSRAALLTGATANPLGVELVLDEPKGRLRLGAAGMKLYRIGAELRIPFAELTMVPRGSMAWGQVQVVVVGVDPLGNQSDLAFRKVPIQVDMSKLEEAREHGYFSYDFTLEVEGGKRSIRVAVEDLLAHTTSAVVADLTL